MNIDLNKLLDPKSLINITAIAVVFYVGLFIAKKLGLRGIGPWKIDYEDNDSMASLNKKNEEADRDLRERLRSFVDDIGHIVEKSFGCTPLVAYSLSQAIRRVLYESVNNNHFTTVLLPKQIEAYKDRILMQMENEYHQVAMIANGQVPSFEEKKDVIASFCDKYIKMAKSETIVTCRQKVKNYEQYGKTLKNTRHKEIAEKKREDNLYYISELEK